MIVLGIDGGSTPENPTGYAFIDTNADSILSYGLLKPANGAHIPDLACQFADLLRRQPYQVRHVAIETPFMGPNARTGLVLAQLVGAYIAIAALAGLPVKGVTPTQAKAALCDGSATKAAMRRAVQLRYGLAVPSHVADAIGVGLASVSYEEDEA